MEDTMTLDEYQDKANQTAVYRYPIVYPVLKLNGEAGELAEKIGKILRDHGGRATDAAFSFPREQRGAIIDELGDVLWYVAAIATDLGVTLSDVAKRNVEKLRSRMERGKIHGDGDER